MKHRLLSALRLLPVFLLLRNCHLACASVPAFADATFGVFLPYDANGESVQAHGGGIIESDGVFYWFGESRKNFNGDKGDFLSFGVNLYSSNDLSSWKYEGLIFNTTQITGMPDPGPYRIERPKILYNEATKVFVLLFHCDLPSFGWPSVGVATGPSIAGPYTWVHSFKPDGQDSFDMGVYQEPDGRAYLVRSVNNAFLGISRLTDDYTSTNGLCSQTIRGEGPAIFSEGDTKFLFSSHLTGWSPNPPQLVFSPQPELCGAEWKEVPAPAEGVGSNTTFDSQSTFVLPLRYGSGETLRMYMGDRWNFAGPGSVANSSYVWLPLLPRVDGAGYELVYLQDWRPRDVIGKMAHGGQLVSLS